MLQGPLLREEAPQHLYGEDALSFLPPVTNEDCHPSKGTLEHYDPELYHKLQNAPVPREATLPPLLVPRNRFGN